MVLILLGQTFALSFQLADQSMWTDEMFTARIVQTASPAEALTQMCLTENRPPLHYLALWGWARLIGNSEWGMRYISISATLLATALTFALGRRLTSRSAALWAALWSATAPTLLFHGRIMRGYTIAVPLALFSTLALWQACHSRGIWSKMIYLLASGLLLFTEYLALPVLGAQILYLGWQYLRERPAESAATTHAGQATWEWLLTGVSMLVILAGVWLTLRWQSANSSGATNNLSASLIPSLSQWLHLPRNIPAMLAAMGFVLYSFGIGEAIFPWHPLAIPGGLAVLAIGWQGLQQLGLNDRARTLIVFSLIIPLLFVGVYLFGFLLGPSMIVVAAARSLYLGPMVSIVLGAGMTQLTNKRITLLLLALVLGARCVSWLNNAVHRDSFNAVYDVPVRELALQVARNARPQDRVVFEAPLPFDLYFRQLNADTPLFTPGPHHIGHTLSRDVAPNAPLFLGQGVVSVSAIEHERLIAYLRGNPPEHLWLVVFQAEGTLDNVETQIAQPLVDAGLYQLAARIGYARQDPLYARLRARMNSRTPIEYKAEIQLYTRTALSK